MAVASTIATPDASESTLALIAGLWHRSVPVVRSRLDTLDRAATASPLTEALHHEALDVAHKLAGSLGMFGFETGTLIARQLEVLLADDEPDAVMLRELTGRLRNVLFPSS